LGGRKGIWRVKKEWWGAGIVVCLERGADLHMVQLMPLPLTISCFSKIQIGSTFLVPAHLGSPEKKAVKMGVCVPFSCQRRISVKINEQYYVDSTSTREGYLNHTAKVTLMLTERLHDSI